MATDPCEHVKDLLVAASIGTFGADTGWSINIGKLPLTPHTALSIIQTGGLASNPKYLLDYPSVQVMIRGEANDYVDTRSKAQEIKDTLLGLPSQDLGNDRIVQINQIGDIASLGFDESNRAMFSVNFRLIIEPAIDIASNRIAL